MSDSPPKPGLSPTELFVYRLLALVGLLAIGAGFVTGIALIRSRLAPTNATPVVYQVTAKPVLPAVSATQPVSVTQSTPFAEVTQLSSDTPVPIVVTGTPLAPTPSDSAVPTGSASSPTDVSSTSTSTPVASLVPPATWTPTMLVLTSTTTTGVPLATNTSSPTPTPTLTRTNAPVVANTFTPTTTSTPTATYTRTRTNTAAISGTLTATRTGTATPTKSATVVATNTFTPTPTPTRTNTLVAGTATATRTFTPTSTITAPPTATLPPTATPLPGCPAVSLPTGTVRIMPLGDSITEAYDGQASYRYWLWHKLIEAGYAVDFVGSQNAVYQGQPAFTDFDRDHEGHWGWRVDQILEQVSTWAAAAQPDVVLIHLGTNDVLFAQQGVPSTIAELGQLIDRLRQVNPNVRILLAQLIPALNRVADIATFNDQIPVLAAQKSTYQSPVLVVDQFTNFDPAMDTYDGAHPNELGEKKMADRWNAALPCVLPLPSLPTPTPTPTVATSLTQGLQSYWQLNERWGLRLDRVGVNYLTDINTVTRAAGKLTYAAEFAAASQQYLTIADNPSLSTGDVDFTLAAWVYLTDKSGSRGIIAKSTGGSFDTFEYGLDYYKTLDTFRLLVSNGTTAAAATWNPSPALNTWYWIVAWHDSTNDQICIQVNNGPPNCTPYTAGGFDSPFPFTIGRNYGAWVWNGRIDGAGFWKRVLTPAERTALYNSGAGCDYPFAACSP